ncbi:uncharacterized protein M6B38_310025 [Iris pallida]|uniref:Uncharacterized protein n=1 Tax=Iris pallida TaxID=29817 RepID=A0AAX6HIX2_IRIPA|nr:uncharacterized protein M6B38_310025 [Iris pallida]
MKNSVATSSSSSSSIDWRGSNSNSMASFPVENPFSLKVGQVFTGFGIGCGIGIGVGRPIYLGAIPALQQVMSATRGATDAFSGVGTNVNSVLRKLGAKNIEAGVGCGVGLGHGFGVGIALKPGMVNRMKSSVAHLMIKLAMSMGLAPRLPSIESVIPGSVQSSLLKASPLVSVLRSTSGGNVQPSLDNLFQLASNTTGFDGQLSRRNGSSHIGPSHIPSASEGSTLDKSHGSRTEKVLDSFLNNPVFKNEVGEINSLAENLRSENNVLQVLLRNQQAIQELMEENQKLRQVLIEDLKVPSSKLQASTGSVTRSNYPCSDCFECRRRRRRRAAR